MNLNQVTVMVSDVERSIAFYKKLGLKLIVKSSPQYARFECPEGDVTFSLHLAKKPVVGETRIYFEVLELDAFVDQLIQEGIRIDEMPEVKPWLWREASLKDPDGNRLILYFAGENRKNPPWKLK